MTLRPVLVSLVLGIVLAACRADPPAAPSRAPSSDPGAPTTTSQAAGTDSFLGTRPIEYLVAPGESSLPTARYYLLFLAGPRAEGTPGFVAALDAFCTQSERIDDPRRRVRAEEDTLAVMPVEDGVILDPLSRARSPDGVRYSFLQSSRWLERLRAATAGGGPADAEALGPGALGFLGSTEDPLALLSGPAAELERAILRDRALVFTDLRALDPDLVGAMVSHLMVNTQTWELESNGDYLAELSAWSAALQPGRYAIEVIDAALAIITWTVASPAAAGGSDGGPTRAFACE